LNPSAPAWKRHASKNPRRKPLGDHCEIKSGSVSIPLHDSGSDGDLRLSMIADRCGQPLLSTTLCYSAQAVFMKSIPALIVCILGVAGFAFAADAPAQEIMFRDVAWDTSPERLPELMHTLGFELTSFGEAGLEFTGEQDELVTVSVKNDSIRDITYVQRVNLAEQVIDFHDYLLTQHGTPVQDVVFESYEVVAWSNARSSVAVSYFLDDDGEYNGISKTYFSPVRHAESGWILDRIDMERWHLLLEPARIAFSFDTRRIETIGGNHRVWIRHDFREPVKNDGASASFMLRHEEVDCSRHRVRVMRV